jgi:LmbE family N-acetylglucosaminyl deacetylase
MDYGNARASEAAALVGLPNGRMISWSKSNYRKNHPDHFAVFNGTIADVSGAGLWWGDLDLTVDEERLVQLAAALETTLYVFYEGDWPRFGAESTVADLPRASFVVRPTGEVEVPDRLSSYAIRDGKGRLVADRTAK